MYPHPKDRSVGCIEPGMTSQINVAENRSSRIERAPDSAPRWKPHGSGQPLLKQRPFLADIPASDGHEQDSLASPVIGKVILEVRHE